MRGMHNVLDSIPTTANFCFHFDSSILGTSLGGGHKVFVSSFLIYLCVYDVCVFKLKLRVSVQQHTSLRHCKDIQSRRRYSLHIYLKHDSYTDNIMKSYK